MFERLGENGRKYMESTEAHLVDYAAAGLRTLAITYRRIEPSEYELWNSEFMKAKMFVGVERDVKLDEASDLIERDLMLIGATAVEDKLQKGGRRVFYTYYQNWLTNIFKEILISSIL